MNDPMTAVIAIGAAVMLLSAAGCGVLVMIAVSIHKVDRSKNLTGQPCTHIDAATRRVLDAGGSTSGSHSERD